MTGIPQSAISDILNGKRQVTHQDMYERLAGGLGIPRRPLGLAPDESVSPARRPAAQPSGPDRRTALAAGVTAAVDVSAGAGMGPPPEDSVTLLGTDGAWTRDDNEKLGALLDTDNGPPVDAATAARLAHEWLVVEPP